MYNILKLIKPYCLKSHNFKQTNNKCLITKLYIECQYAEFRQSK